MAALPWVERVHRPAPEVPMQAHQTTHLLRQVRCWLAVRALDALADPDLLERFRRERNEAAFAVLLERHGPLVLRVCGRLLDDGTRSKPQVKVGEKVLFTSYAPETIKLSDQELLLMREEDILAVIE